MPHWFRWSLIIAISHYGLVSLSLFFLISESSEEAISARWIYSFHYMEYSFLLPLLSIFIAIFELVKGGKHYASILSTILSGMYVIFFLIYFLSFRSILSMMGEI